MPRSSSDPGPFPEHGASRLDSVDIASYSLDLRDDEGLVGDRASQTAFRERIDAWRAHWRARSGDDPFGDTPTGRLEKHQLDRALQRPDDEAARLVERAIDEFAGELAEVIRRFRQLPAWRPVERVIVGGGFQRSEIGHLALRRTAVMLQGDAEDVELKTLHHEPDEGGLIGWVHLVPRPLLSRYDALLAVDIGGTNVRCGLVAPRLAQAADLSQAEVLKRDKWRHASEQPERDEMLDGLGEMLTGLVEAAAADGLRLAPFVGVACPGVVRDDGVIARGAQNLPGDWEGGRFHLPRALARRLPRLPGGRTLRVAMHNDAVVQGLSELPHTQDVRHWAVLTIGTGLGNASYVNRSPSGPAR